MKLSVKKLFEFMYAPNALMAKLYPKAAKKRRIRNKWRNRFGYDFNMKDMVQEMVGQRNPFLETLLKEPFSEGKYYPVPIIKGDDE